MKYTLCLLLCIFLMFDSPVHGQIIRTYAGNGISGYGGDSGPATAALLDSPSCITIDGTGNIYFTDQLNYCIRKVDLSGTITTVAGNGFEGLGGDGGPATAAQMSDAWGVAADGAGNLYITDQQYYRVRKVNTAGIISTFAGGTYGTGGDNGPAASAQLERPIGIAVDPAGNVYIGDQQAFTIKKVSTAGIITTFAGTAGDPGFFGDGTPATNAKFLATYGLAADNAGNVYICDAENNRVRKVNTAGIITTVAGNGMPGFGGDGGQATACKLNHPTGVCVDHEGNLLITDSYNNCIRRVNPSGIIRTIAGTGSYGFSGDEGLCLNAKMAHPNTVVEDAAQNIYFVDFRNNRVRKISKEVFFAGGHIDSVHVCQNSSFNAVDSVLAVIDKALGLIDTWTIASPPPHGIAIISYATPATGSTVTPVGLFYSPFSGFTGIDSFKVVVSNGIMSDTTTIYVNVVPLIHTAGTITGDSAVCIGSTIILSDTIPNGIWTISNLNAIAPGGVVTGELAGNDTITYTITNICGTASTSKVITINPLPYVGTITGANELCVGSSVTLSDTVVGGVWSDANSSVSINSLANLCIVTGLFPVTDTIFYTVTDSLCSATAELPIIIETTPTAAIAGSVTDICVGATMELYGVPPGGAWSLSNNAAIFTPDSTGIKLKGITAGLDIASYNITNFCGTFTATYSFTVDSLPPKPVITQDQGTAYVPSGYASYQWMLNGLVISGAVVDSYELKKAGIYGVTVTNSYGCPIASDTINFGGCDVDDIVIFPNPGQSVVYIQWCKKLTARLLCMDGRQVMTIHDTNQIDLTGLADEDYMLVLFDAKGNKLKVKYVVKRTH